MQKVTCDTCEKEFTVRPKTDKRGISVEIHYFDCPNCKKRYISHVTDPECRRMQRDIVNERKSRNDTAALLVKDLISEKEYRKRIDLSDAKVKAIQDKLSLRMNKLKTMYS